MGFPLDLCYKSLLKYKNEGFEVALDNVFIMQKEQIEKETLKSILLNSNKINYYRIKIRKEESKKK